MTNYIETLWEYIETHTIVNASEFYAGVKVPTQSEAIATLERLEKQIDELHKSQGYVYIGKDGKAISARELEDDRDSLRKALDDRFAADQRAAKAIFAATGRTSGFPSVKDVVAFYVAEAERLEKLLADESEELCTVSNYNLEAMLTERKRADAAEAERDSLRAKLATTEAEAERLRARLFPEDSPPADQERDHLADQCTTLLHENDAIRAKLERAKEVLSNAIAGIEAWCEAIQEKGTGWDDWDEHYKEFAYRGGLDEMRAVLAELSADTPTQLCPVHGKPFPCCVDFDLSQQTQISDEAREAMEEAEKVLTEVRDLLCYKSQNTVNKAVAEANVNAAFHAAESGRAKLRSVMK